MPQRWDIFFYFPSEEMHTEDFPDARKIQRLRPGLNPQTWVPEASMLTTRPPKLSFICVRDKVKGDDAWTCIVSQLLQILSDASNTSVDIIYIYQYMHINCIKLYVIHERKPLLQASAIYHHPQGDINAKEYIILIYQFYMYNVNNV